MCAHGCICVCAHHKLRTDKDGKKNTKLEPHRQNRLSAVWTRSGGKQGRGRKRERNDREMRDILFETKKESKRLKRKMQDAETRDERLH